MSDSGSGDGGRFVLSRRNAWVAIALLSVAASITGLLNGFALDDVFAIVRNPNVHSLGRAWWVFGESYWPAAQGGALYRPLTSLGFVVQWAIGGGSPLPFHVVSILLYAAACVAFYELAILIVAPAAALAAAAVFAVHPLHVEAVANRANVRDARRFVGAIGASNGPLSQLLRHARLGPHIQHNVLCLPSTV